MNPREQGKLYFQKGKFTAAAESYTEAITLEPTVAALYQNRALCFQKLSRWADVLADSEQALKLLESSGSSSVKALYLQGTANLNLRRLDSAQESFERALSQSSSPEFASYRPSIEKGLCSVHAQKWEEEQARLESEDHANYSLVQDLITEAAQLDGHTQALHDLETQVADLCRRAVAQRERPQVPECLCCQITFEVIKDPVLTPSGQTFERDAIECHLAQNGQWDPVTRHPLTKAQLVPNHALRLVVEDFVKRNPWAVA
mmetsp:Transcript_15939/g.33890  ORF Transcript_15939/g.33890 Transcript_15939/m.33890 type:complete len:260 (-) Transcript_15939:282-1061(-)